MRRSSPLKDKDLLECALQREAEARVCAWAPHTVPALPGAFVTSEDGNTLAPAGCFRQQCRRSQPAAPPLAAPTALAWCGSTKVSQPLLHQGSFRSALGSSRMQRSAPNFTTPLPQREGRPSSYRRKGTKMFAHANESSSSYERTATTVDSERKEHNLPRLPLLSPRSAVLPPRTSDGGCGGRCTCGRGVTQHCLG